jgi:acyl-CoA synthetase (AMP-forming)/AMP-acid ligase II
VHTQSLPDLLSVRAATVGDKTLYRYVPPRATTPLTLTYRELHDHSCLLAAALRERGLRRKNALLMYPPGLDFIEAFFSCMRGSISPVPMYIPPGDSPDIRLSGVTSKLEIAAVLTVRANHEQVSKQIAELFPDGACEVICTDELLQRGGVATELPVDLEQPALIQFTSGSTSDPKGVVVSHANLIANQGMIERGFYRHAQLRGGETTVSWLPFFHDMGLICGIMHPLYMGGDAVLMSPNDFLRYPQKWLQLISTYKGNIVGSPNFGYEYCATRITDEQLEGLDLSSLKVAYNGAEMIRPLTMKRFCDRFAPYGFQAKALFYCYGMAETTLYVSGGTGQPGSPDAPDAIAAVGPPDEKSEVLIVDEERNVLPDGSAGDIWVRGPHVARGYFNNPEATEARFGAKPVGRESGPAFLRTGDLGYLLQGQLYIVGRVKNLLIVNGKNYYGEEIEYLVGRSHEYFIESGACILQTNEGLPSSEIIFMQELKKSSLAAAKADLPYLEQTALKLSRQILNDFQLSIHRFVFLRAGRLPRTSSGKIDRKRGKELAMSDVSNYVHEVSTR